MKNGGMPSGEKKNKGLQLLLFFFHSVWRRKLRLLILAAATLFVLLLISAGRYGQTAAGEITLSYSNAFKGLNPNGTRFNIYDITSDEIISQVLEETALDKVMTKDAFVDCISISPSVTQSISKRYISNVYDIRFELPEDLPYKLDAKNVLQQLLKTYHTAFNDKYVLNRAVLDMDWSYVSDLEYMEFIDLVNMRVQNLADFLDELAVSSSATSYKLQGESFKSLKNSLENFKTVYLDKYAAYVNIQNVFRDAETYAETLNYRCLLLDREHSAADRLHRVYKDVLSSYDEAVIAFVMVPMYNSSDGLYMARTTTGMDSLAIRSSDYSEASKALAEQITLCREEMSAAQSVQPNEADIANAESMIAAIIREMDALVARVHHSVDEYQLHSADSDITCVLKYPAITQAYALKKNIIRTCSLMLLLCVSFAVVDWRRSLEKE